MTLEKMSELVGRPGVDALLEYLRTSPTGPAYSLARNVVAENGAASPDSTLTSLESRGVVAITGDDIYLTSVGRRIALLVDAINGGDINELMRLLSRRNTNAQFEIVRQGMAHNFIADLRQRSDFGALSICSPWINLDRRELSDLSLAVRRARTRFGEYVKIRVIVRPDRDTGLEPDGVRPLKALGAEVSIRRNIHTKLYIREPGRRGGDLVAIVGSENLTRTRNLELGIRIENDSEIVNQLIRYFYEIYQAGDRA